MTRWQECLKHLQMAQTIIREESHKEWSCLDSYVDTVDVASALDDIIASVEWEMK